MTGADEMVQEEKVEACTDCHVGSNYTFTVANTDCYGCHQAAWQSTTTLGGAITNHITAGFPTSQCSTCHNTNTWTSTFNHATTRSPVPNAEHKSLAYNVSRLTVCN